jgi:hypothetical protein
LPVSTNNTAQPPTLGTSTSSPLHARAKVERRRQLPAREAIKSERRCCSAAARAASARATFAARRCAEIDEYAHLAAQDRRHDRSQDIVDGTELVTSLRLHLIGIRRHENDRRVRRAPVLADQLGRLDAVHVRHVDVEHDDGELALEQLAQRFGAGADEDEILVEIVEHLAER